MNQDLLKPQDYTGRDIGYWRVSTPDQDPEYQIAELKKAGIPDDLIFGEKLTGSHMNRPQLQVAMKIADRGDCLVVWKLDRLGRSLKDVLGAIDELSARGINIRSLTQPIDSTDSVGRLVMSILLAVAEMERDLISERTRAGMRSKKERDPSWKPGRKHYITGYPKRVKWVTDMLAKDGLSGMTGKQIIDGLNKADPKAPQIKVPQVWFNFKRQGLPGIELPGENVDED